ncbi:putative dash complex subunit spc34 [Erysiphe neolycopersici]|uniref:DASH complex subunit SPC34 n=1 Tax=Erysiphe neolycopersici TaxID=212602 RepID=A0A420HS89_9PEZI|nr:putative dash complex subunit spc34 [Erysiphe neolycopersici]
MSYLDKYLEQISLSAESIESLSFQTRKIFTNALLRTPDITSLIRDTEPHERALFSVLSSQESVSASKPDKSKTSSRRQTVFNVAHGEVMAPRMSTRALRRNTVVTTALGIDLQREMKKTEGRINGEVDVEVLLRGVEKLNAVYSIPGTLEQVQDLRNRFAQVSRTIAQYEGKVERQTSELDRMNRGIQKENGEHDYNIEDKDDNVNSQVEDEDALLDSMITDEDILKEENEIKELEDRRRQLQESINRMDRNLGKHPSR